MRGIPWWLSSKEPACNVGDTGDTGSTQGLNPGLRHCRQILYHLSPRDLLAGVGHVMAQIYKK